MTATNNRNASNGGGVVVLLLQFLTLFVAFGGGFFLASFTNNTHDLLLLKEEGSCGATGDDLSSVMEDAFQELNMVLEETGNMLKAEEEAKNNNLPVVLPEEEEEEVDRAGSTNKSDRTTPSSTTIGVGTSSKRGRLGSGSQEERGAPPSDHQKAAKVATKKRDYYYSSPSDRKHRKLGITKKLNKEVKKYKDAAKKYENMYKEAKDLASKYKKDALNFKNQALDYADELDEEIGKVQGLQRDILDNLDEIDDLTHSLETATNKVTSLTTQVDHWKSVGNTLNGQINTFKNTMDSIPGKIDSKIVRPILKAADKATEELKKVEDVAGDIAQSTVDAIMALNFLPKAEDLAEELGKALLKVLAKDEFCIPYSCIMDKFKVDIDNIKLYDTNRLTVTTALKPETCLEVSSIVLDDSKLQAMLDVFGEVEALDDIAQEIKTFLDKEVEKIFKHTGAADVSLKEIKNVANNAIKAMDVTQWGRRRRLLEGGEEEVALSRDEVSAIAYQKGKAKFDELFGAHVRRVYEERNLGQNGANYIGFKALELKFSANFGQTLTLNATKTAGFAGSLFDESFSQQQVFPVPLTAGMVKIVAAGSMKASMPYVMNMNAQGKAVFGYSVGQTDITMDLVSGTVTKNKEKFSTDISLDASIGVSASMSINFAASASLGVCVGPSNDACITVKIDAKQSSAAGFDILAQYNNDGKENALTAMYTDKLEYDATPNCDDEVTIGAGYWQYVEEPSVLVAIEGTHGCGGSSNDILYEREGGLIFHDIKNYCLELGLPIPIL